MNPEWYEIMKMNVTLQKLDNSDQIQGMMLMVFDEDLDDNDDLIGRCWINFKT